MRLRIKVLQSNKSEWLGWFGEEVVKLRLQSSVYSLQSPKGIEESLKLFLQKDLGIKEKDIQVLKVEKNFVTIELPDVAWELFLTAID